MLDLLGGVPHEQGSQGRVGGLFNKPLTEGSFHGLADEVIGSLVCPIGIPGIRSKRPESIATAVTAQLLERDEMLRAGEASSAVPESTRSRLRT